MDDTLDFGNLGGPHTSMMQANDGQKQEQDRRDSDLSIFTSTTNDPSRRATRAYSTTPSSHDSIFDAVPFMAPLPSGSNTTTAAITARLPPTPTSPYFPLPPPRSPSGKPVNTLAPEANPFSDSNATAQNSFASNEATYGDVDELGDLPMPIRPFAGGANHASRDSTSSAMSGRSGYASVLEGIPFQLGLGGTSQRGSLAYSENGDNRSSFASSYFGNGRPDSTQQNDIPPVPSLPTLPSQSSINTQVNGQVEEAEQEVEIGSQSDQEALKTARLLPAAASQVTPDARASVDSFMQSAILANQFSELPDP